MRSIVTLIDPDDQDRLREMEDWIVKNEGTWVLSEGFNPFLGENALTLIHRILGCLIALI